MQKFERKVGKQESPLATVEKGNLNFYGHVAIQGYSVNKSTKTELLDQGSVVFHECHRWTA